MRICIILSGQLDSCRFYVAVMCENCNIHLPEVVLVLSHSGYELCLGPRRPHLEDSIRPDGAKKF
jgi:hypothetical protein